MAISLDKTPSCPSYCADLLRDLHVKPLFFGFTIHVLLDFSKLLVESGWLRGLVPLVILWR